MKASLREIFGGLAGNYSDDPRLKEELWGEIEEQYSGKKRHYHTLAHLENMLGELENVRENIRDRDAVLFALFYHDVVYNTVNSDNEEQSAELAVKRMLALGVSEERVMKCRTLILATKKHASSPDNDTNLFTDADLSILGKDWETYTAYCRNVRLEYSVYPDFVYKPGRKNVLKHFLLMDRIFKTEHFFNLYEKQARSNMKSEFGEL